jgi:transposase
MPQLQLPIFPVGVTHITALLAFEVKDDQVSYCYGSLPVFVHARNDLATFRMITSQIVANGQAKQAEISRAFGVPLGTVKRYVKRYREAGPKTFYQARGTRGPSVLVPEVVEAVQQELDAGVPLARIAVAMGLKRDTLRKAVQTGTLRRGPDQKKV